MSRHGSDDHLWLLLEYLFNSIRPQPSPAVAAVKVRASLRTARSLSTWSRLRNSVVPAMVSSYLRRRVLVKLKPAQATTPSNCLPSVTERASSAHSVCRPRTKRSTFRTTSRCDCSDLLFDAPCPDRSEQIHTTVTLGNPTDLPGFGLRVDIRVTGLDGVADKDGLVAAAHAVRRTRFN